MIKRGDVVQLNLKRMDGLIEIGILRDADYLISAHDGKAQSTAGYEMTKPPVYGKDGQRFVPSGEFREPNEGESYLSPNGVVESWSKHAWTISKLFSTECNDGRFRRILLPTPELEPEHEFEVGDWVRFDNGESKYTFQVSKIIPGSLFDSCDNEYYPLNICTKLPGRPLTTDDLMQVLSGKKVRVECHACECDGVREHLTMNMGCGNVQVHHGNNPNWVACLRGGYIVFADGVEGNIYIVGEA